MNIIPRAARNTDASLPLRRSHALDLLYRVQSTRLTVDWTLKCGEAAYVTSIVIYRRKNSSFSTVE
jgi:hypothetical protein